MKRIQRMRVKNWRMPKNTVYVGRPSIYGNPFKIGGEDERISSLYQFNVYLEEKLEKDPHFLDKLRGKNLSCWCKLDMPCHADVILLYLKPANQKFMEQRKTVLDILFQSNVK